MRQFHLDTVRPLARLLETELTAKLAEPVRLGFDLYNADLQGRATALKSMVASGMEIERAASVSGLLMEE